MEDTRISVGGLMDKALVKYLENNDKINEIIFCFDNDFDKDINRGQEFARKCYDKFEKMGYDVKLHIPTNKDFNADLQHYKKSVLNKIITNKRKIEPKNQNKKQQNIEI